MRSSGSTCIGVIGYGSFITFRGFVVARFYVICVRYLRVNPPGVRVWPLTPGGLPVQIPTHRSSRKVMT